MQRRASAAPLIAVVEDDEATRTLFRDLLTDAGYRTLFWPQGKDAHLRIRETKPDLVILDLWLEDQDAGMTVLDLMEHDQRTRRIPVIVCSAHLSTLRRHERRLRRKRYSIVQKPFTVNDLLLRIAEVLAPRAA